MSNRYKIINQLGMNFMTMTIVGWVDIFSRQRYRDIAIESLRYCQKEKGLIIHAYVIMTNHIHIAKFNKTAQEYQIWTHDNHPIALWSKDVIAQKIDYIHFNPVKAG